MGVQGLWTIVQPCARPTNLATLNKKRLAVDASIWIYQFLKAVRDKEGNALRNSHVVGFFRRICKLLWFGIRPVFVFDGGAPALKRATLQARRRRREGRREDATRTAGKLLAVQMHRMAEEEEEKRKRAEAVASSTREVGDEQEQLPDMDQIVYADELGMSQQERQKTRRFHKQDAYHLPDLGGSMDRMGRPEDPRIMSVEELEEYAQQFHNGEDINLYDFSKIDFDGEFFKSLPPADRYNILNAARLRSRLRMGLSKEQLDVMFPDRMAFSRFQIERVKERNHLTQRLMYEMGMTGTDLTVGVNARVAGEKNREYILVKNEGAEGGWALGVVGGAKDKGEIHNPIDVDSLDFQFQTKDDDEWEDEEFEDIPIEGLNRLPKAQNSATGSGRHGDLGNDMEVDDTEESLFVGNSNFDNNPSEDEGALFDDVDEDLNRAIEMSLQNPQSLVVREPGKDEATDEDERPSPEWIQKVSEPSRPIVSTSGRMVAHIVNNRANASVPKRRRGSASSDSDSDGDIRVALAAARKKQKPAPKPSEKTPAKPSAPKPFDGPLPFEKLDWRNMFTASRPFSTVKKPQNPKEVETHTEIDGMDDDLDDDAGGFEKEVPEKNVQEDESSQEPQEEAPRPLPPWMTDTTDIRESLRKQQEIDREMNAEDEEMARQDELLFRRRREDETIHIDSSDEDDSDIEILDVPPPRKPTTLKEPGASLPGPEDDTADTTAAQRETETTTQVQSTGSVSTHMSFQISMGPSKANSSESSHNKKTEADSAAQVEDESGDEFEDVVVPPQARPSLPERAAQQEMDDALIEAELFGDIDTLAEHQNNNDYEVVDSNAPSLEAFDDFSDPEEEQLLAQLAEEAEEHARFASELNNKTQEENQEAYERELKALRAQQKKDRRDADEVTQVMVSECQALLRLFGIPYITAPMEAEAQCAELVHLNLVDGIVTDDSDTFLFGGTRVYKNMFNSNKYVECYLASEIEKELSLSREQLIALAQLLGSDYTEGLPGVGPVTAVEILSEFPGQEGLAAFKEWWHEVQQGTRPKEADVLSPFRRKFRKSHATKLFLPVGFPSAAVSDAYLHPEVDKDPEQFQWGVPDLEGLRRFLMATIGWSQERTDEVLVPVIRDMNKREAEGTQSNITRYFEGSVGAGASEAFAPRQRAAKGSKRMADAVSKLRAKSGAGGGGLSTELPVMAPPPVPGAKGKKGRKRKALVIEEDDDLDNGRP